MVASIQAACQVARSLRTKPTTAAARRVAQNRAKLLVALLVQVSWQLERRSLRQWLLTREAACLPAPGQTLQHVARTPVPLRQPPCRPPFAHLPQTGLP